MCAQVDDEVVLAIGGVAAHVTRERLVRLLLLALRLQVIHEHCVNERETVSGKMTEPFIL